MVLKSKPLRVAGLMSGTSADGIDAAIIDYDGRAMKLLAFYTFPYPPEIRRRIFNLFDPRTGRVDEICRMNFLLGELFAGAVINLARRHRIPLDSIDLIGSHGQTIHHLPNPPRSTLQIGEPSIIAERTGITTVADFRPRDIAAGGQGAPLVPFADFLLFRHPKLARAVQNIGGIANVTYLPPGAGPDRVIAFDTGPGNMIIDRLAELVTHGKNKFDPNGRLASRGTVNFKLLTRLLRHPFLKLSPPKTTGRETFGRQFSDRLFPSARKQGIADGDLLATATAFTSRTIADAYRNFLPGKIDELILCGGGAWNRTLVRMLRQELPATRVALMSEFGLHPDAKEAVSFALLAYVAARGLPNNVPAATGADHPAILGKIIPGRKHPVF